MQMESLGWIVAVLVVVLAVFGLFVVGRGRRALQEQARAGQSAAAVAESRLADLAAAHAALNEAHRALSAEHLALSGEREALRTSLAKTTEDLRRAVVESNGLRQSLDQSVANAARLDADLRVAVANTASLTQRVDALEVRIRGADEANRLQADRYAEVAAQAKALVTQRDALLAQLAEQKNWVVEQTAIFRGESHDRHGEADGRAFAAPSPKSTSARWTQWCCRSRRSSRSSASASTRSTRPRRANAANCTSRSCNSRT